MREAGGSNSDSSQQNASEIKFPWFALQVRTRHEGCVADYLDGKGYESFLPLYKCRKRWSDRIKEVETPLFPGYLFCRFDPEERLPILKTPGVIQIVGYNHSSTPVDETEISAIQTLVATGIPNRPWPFLHAGDTVRIQSGPLRGLQGVLVSFKGNCRLVLSLTLLQRSVAVEIDSAFVAAGRVAAKHPERARLQLRPMDAAV
jgi:transcription antitermination factor NusG